MKNLRHLLGVFSIITLFDFLFGAMTITLPDNHVPNNDPWGYIILVWLVLSFFTGGAMAVGEYKPLLNIATVVAYGLTIWWTLATPDDGSDLKLSMLMQVIGFTTVFVVPIIHFLDLILGYLANKEPKDGENTYA